MIFDFDFFEEKTPARLVGKVEDAPMPTRLEWFVGIGTVVVVCFGLITIIGGV